MKVPISFLIVALGSLLVIPEGCAGVEHAVLNNYGTYIFQNVGDSGFLTAVGGNDAIATDLWRNVPGQFWQVTKGFIYSSYMLKPLLGDGNKFGMSISSVNGILSVKKVPYTFGMSSSLYWSALPLQENIYMLQNLETEKCLESNGFGYPVTVSVCDNRSKTQQWVGHPR